MLWLLLTLWPVVGLLVGCLLGRSIAIEEDHAARHAPELLPERTGQAGVDPDASYALAQQD
jgi:hypothetical protein